MDDPASSVVLATDPRSAQDYIDELPAWQDGTEASHAPITAMQWRIWWLATAGKFFEGLVVFMTGVSLPLIGREFDLSAAQHGLIGAAPLFGILVGATALGGLSDRFGRKSMFIVEMAILVAFLVLVCLSPGFLWLAICLIGVGMALGCDYPTAHLIISESIPSRSRGKLVLGAFAFQAVGALVGTGVGYLILAEQPELGAWRWMYATAILPAALVMLGRCFITDSAHWLLVRGRIHDAERALGKLLHRVPTYPKTFRLKTPHGDSHRSHAAAGSYRMLFSKRCRRATILASIPWFLQDLGTYGIGIFTPTILASTIGRERLHAQSVSDIVLNDLLAARGAAVIDVLLIVGILAAVLLTDRIGRIRLQMIGFVGCAAGLLVASWSIDASGSTKMVLIFAGFMLFSLMTNLGPNAQTYLLSGEVFPTEVRARGAGFAASFAKLGASLAAFLFPILLADIGTLALLYGLMGTSLLGAMITWLYRIETAGVSLEKIGKP
jgi:MFS transporter, putative metabolite transport protein